MKKAKPHITPRTGEDADLLDAPGLEAVSRLTSDLLKVSKSVVDAKQAGTNRKPPPK